MHQDARRDIRQAQRHRAFIVSRLIAACAGLAVFPFCLAYYGMPTFTDACLLLCLFIPLAAALMVSLTGRLEAAHILSTSCLIGMTGYMALYSGGMNSMLVAWLLITVVDAALTGSARVTMFGIIAAALMCALLAILTFADMLPNIHYLSLASLARLVAAVSLMGNAFALSMQLEKKLAVEESKVQAKKNLSSLLAEQAADMLTLHSRNGNLLYATGSADVLLTPVDNISPTAFFDRVHVQDRPAFLKMFEDAALTGKMGSLQFRLRQRGDWIWVETKCNPLSVEGQINAKQFAAVTRVLANQNPEEMLRLSEEADKANIAKTRFLAHVSHELRTPLNAILGFSEMMTGKNGFPLNPQKHTEYAELIQESGRHLLGIVNTILDLSKIEAGSFALQPEPFQPAELVEKCLSLMEPAAIKNNVHLRKASHGAMPEILADRRACKQILLNLLSNAVKFTPAGGKVNVSLRSSGDSLSIIVSDTGIGIDKAELPLLGQPFMQAQNSYARQFEGTGLGLSLVKSLAELQGGTMHIFSEHGKGTVVTITLPRSPTKKQGDESQSQPLLRAAV